MHVSLADLGVLRSNANTMDFDLQKIILNEEYIMLYTAINSLNFYLKLDFLYLMLEPV